MAGEAWKLVGLSLILAGSLTALGIIQLTFLTGVGPVGTFGQVFCPIPFYVCLTTSITFSFLSNLVGLLFVFGGFMLYYKGMRSHE